MLNVLPEPVARRLKDSHGIIADEHPEATVLFADLVGFTELAERMPADELVALLDRIFARWDALAAEHGVEKIKTIGDAYMAAAGVPVGRADHAAAIAAMALAMPTEVEGCAHDLGDDLALRIGIDSGPVVAGVIGQSRFIYDLWGDTVNTASRMESHGEAGKIHVSEEFKQALQKGPGLFQESPTSPTSLHFQERGEMAIKGKGMMKTYFLERKND